MISLSHRNTQPQQFFPKFGEHHLVVIDEALKKAWNQVISKDHDRINDLSEEQITEKIEFETQRLLDTGSIQGFNKGIFESIVRGAKCCSFNGKHIETAPDLRIKLIDIRPGMEDSRHDALFIECKIIEKSKAPLLYIKDGIKRFVDGDYAWAMPQAMMLAYVRGDYSIPSSLEKTFIRNASNKVISKCMPIRNQYKFIPNLKMPNTMLTSHKREWDHQTSGSPGNIDIIHIWFDCPNPPEN